MATHYLDMLKKVSKLPIYTDVDTLDTYCEYVLNDDNKNINYANLLNLQEYITSLDETVLQNNDSKYARYLFVKYYLNPKGTSIYGGEVATGSYYNGATLTGVNTKYATDKNWANRVYQHMQYLYNKL